MELHLGNILEGWENYFVENPVIEKVAIERAKHCSGCDFAKSGFISIFVNDDIKEIKGLTCKKCSCPLSAKVRSTNEKCPIGLW
jgi:hypothetical protein